MHVHAFTRGWFGAAKANFSIDSSKRTLFSFKVVRVSGIRSNSRISRGSTNLQYPIREAGFCKLHNAQFILKQIISWPSSNEYLEEKTTKAINICGS
jgi:hypothetical protein